VLLQIKEASELIKQRDQLANIDFVKVDYAAFAAKNPVKVTTKDLADYIQKHPVMFKSPATRNLGIVFFPASQVLRMMLWFLKKLINYTM
jgi:peptidyl-prolyl cis-trans isomerase D